MGALTYDSKKATFTGGKLIMTATRTIEWGDKYVYLRLGPEVDRQLPANMADPATAQEGLPSRHTCSSKTSAAPAAVSGTSPRSCGLYMKPSHPVPCWRASGEVYLSIRRGTVSSN